MLPLSDVSDLVHRSVMAELGMLPKQLRIGVIRDPDGGEAFDVEVILSPEVAGLEFVDAQVKASTQVQLELSRLEESRFAYIHYTTEAELADLDG